MATEWVTRAVKPALSTKLQPQGLPRDFFARPRLHDRLDAGSEAGLTLVCAPAGFAKTTLLGGWIRRSSRPWAWLSLDEHDSELATFVRGFVAAVQTVCPDTGSRTLGLLAQPELPPLSYLGVTLADELAQTGLDLIVVLDDYHLIRDRAVHVLLSTLLHRLSPNVQLVVAGRDEPPLPTAALRARGALVEIHATDLRFDLEETRGFLERACGARLSPAVVSDVHRRSSGWPVALRLAVLASADVPGELDRATALRAGGQRFVDDYVLEEVLGRQPPALRSFLLRTAILDRLGPSVCDALVADEAPAQGRALLDHAERAGLFLAPLNGHGSWYRYHDVFRDALLRRLALEIDQAAIRALHARASAWFADQGLVDEAVEHALAAGDVEGAATLVEANVDAGLAGAEWTAIESWLRRLPPEVVDARPMLGLADARVLLVRGKIGPLGARLDRIETLVCEREHDLGPATSSAIRGEAAAMRSYVLVFRGGPDQLAHELAVTALRQVPKEHVYMRGDAGAIYGITSQIVGRGEEALHWVREELRQVGEGNPYSVGMLLVAQGYVELGSGRLDQLEHTARQLLALASEHALVGDQGWGHLFLGRVSYEWNQLDAAREHYAAVLAARDRTNSRCVHCATVGLALSLLASGRSDDARHLILDELALAERTSNLPAVEGLRSFAARLALAAGDATAAATWMDAVPDDPIPLAAVDIEGPLPTRARVLLARDTRTSLREATAVLDRALAGSEARHNGPAIVGALALRALVERALGDADGATRTLTRALELAERGRFTRTFLDLGPPMAGLLVELVGPARPGPARDGAERILKASRAAAASSEPALPSRVVAPGDYDEPLTWRELEILQLLDARYSNKEIARTLCISWQTVKTHAGNIYGKLGVSGRRDAVARARALGVLSESGTRVLA